MSAAVCLGGVILTLCSLYTPRAKEARRHIQATEAVLHEKILERSQLPLQQEIERLGEEVRSWEKEIPSSITTMGIVCMVGGLVLGGIVIFLTN
ncbi:MAG TPA: hypothetical protein VFA52_00830 [Candidatus Paceibacterota bacterium]|nr:hypothetical protein [Candidatus Paceibacterota bacterium]